MNRILQKCVPSPSIARARVRVERCLLLAKKFALTNAQFRIKNEREVPLGVGIIVAPFWRDQHDRCLHQCRCSGWLASVASAHPSPPRPSADPFLRDHTARSGQMHPGDQKSRPPARAQSARCNLTGTADHPNPRLGSEAFPGSVSLRARATGSFLGRLAVACRSHGAPRAWRHSAYLG
jgi:hypothetical protein